MKTFVSLIDAIQTYNIKAHLSKDICLVLLQRRGEIEYTCAHLEIKNNASSLTLHDMMVKLNLKCIRYNKFSYFVSEDFRQRLQKNVSHMQSSWTCATITTIVITYHNQTNSFKSLHRHNLTESANSKIAEDLYLLTILKFYSILNGNKFLFSWL